MVEPGSRTETCKRCKGEGEFKIYEPSPQGAPDWVLVQCSECNGKGRVSLMVRHQS